MREVLFKGKRKDNGEWIESYTVIHFSNNGFYMPDLHNGAGLKTNEFGNIVGLISLIYEVIPETVGQYTGLTDKNGKKIFEGDIVKILDTHIGEVVVVSGAFGIGTHLCIEWGLLECEIEDITGCQNSPCFCYNDNFVSLWELMWNYNQEENSCFVVEVIGNIHDNPELIKKN